MFLAEEGPVLSGIGGMRNLIVFCLLLFGAIGIIRECGLFEKISAFLFARCRMEKQAEWVLVMAATLSVLVIGADVPNVTIMSPVTENLIQKGASKDRISFLLDGISTGICSLLPHNPGLMTAVTLGSSVISVRFVEMARYNLYGLFFIGCVLLSMVPIPFRKEKTYATSDRTYERLAVRKD